jgi:hypothetical protein
MRTRAGWLGVLLGTGLTLAPTAAWGQGELDYIGVGQPEPVWPLPVYQDRPETGGFYVSVDGFVYWRQTESLAQQAIAVPTSNDLVPLYQDRPERGGFFASGSFLYWCQTNPLQTKRWP